MDSHSDSVALFFAVFMVISAVLLAGLDIYCGVEGWMKYDREIGSYWALADRASTLPQKSVYIDKFVNALENRGLAGKYDAIFYPRLSNSFDANLEALKSFQTRLREIQGMDVKSFAYQTAIQQITAQEQGEAREMLSVFQGVWWKDNYPLTWSWILGLNLLCISLLAIVGSCGWYNIKNYGSWWA